VVDVTDDGTFVSGLWSDSKILRKNSFLTRVELCRDVNPQNNWYIDPLEKSGWDSPRIYVWTSWQGVKKGDRLIMEWLGPSGQSVADYTHEVGDFESRSYQFWSWIEPNDLKVENPGGTWIVKIGINDRLIEEYPVVVETGQRE